MLQAQYERTEPKYYTRVPNIIDDLTYDDDGGVKKLSIYAKELYRVVKRTAGDNGRCWKSTRLLADECGMSVGKVSQAKKELQQPMHQLNGKPLIEIHKCRMKQDGGRENDVVIVVDIWRENIDHMENPKAKPSSQGEQRSSSHELGAPPSSPHELRSRTPSSRGERPSSPRELKNNQEKKNQKRRTTTAQLTSQSSTTAPSNVVVSLSEEEGKRPSHACLDQVKMTEEERLRFTEAFPDETVVREAVDACLQHGEKISNPFGWMKRAIDEGWKLHQSKETLEAKAEEQRQQRTHLAGARKEKLQLLLETLDPAVQQDISVSDTCVTFNFGSRGVLPLGYTEEGFETKLKLAVDRCVKRHATAARAVG